VILHRVRVLVSAPVPARYRVVPGASETFVPAPVLPAWLLTRGLAKRWPGRVVVGAGADPGRNMPDKLFDVYGVYVYPAPAPDKTVVARSAVFGDGVLAINPAYVDPTYWRVALSFAPGATTETFAWSRHRLPGRVAVRFASRDGAAVLYTEPVPFECGNGEFTWPYSGAPAPGATVLASFREETVWAGGSGPALYVGDEVLRDVLGVCDGRVHG